MSFNRNLDHKHIALNDKRNQRIIALLEDLVDDATKTNSTKLLDNISVSANDFTNSVDIQKFRNHSVFGTSSGTNTIEVHISDDNSTFFKSSTSISITGSGAFNSDFSTSAKYVKLKMLSAGTLTLILSSKD